MCSFDVYTHTQLSEVNVRVRKRNLRQGVKKIFLSLLLFLLCVTCEHVCICVVNWFLLMSDRRWLLLQLMLLLLILVVRRNEFFFSFIYILFSFSINKNVNEEKLFQLYYEHERRVFFTKWKKSKFLFPIHFLVYIKNTFLL